MPKEIPSRSTTIIECQRTGYLKHYYIENERIVTKLGHGKFTNITFPASALTAGNIDYGKRAAQIEQNRLDYYASLGVSPGPPTDKNYWARPENSGIAAPVYTDSTATMVPRGWPGNTTPPPNGPPVFVDPVPSNDSVKAGYGFSDPGHLVENSQYFYHADALGNTNYITNSPGEVSLYMEYAPLGETVQSAHTGSYTTPYLFNAKEKDIVTGYYFYGPQYYEPVSSQWLNIADPLGEKWLAEVNAYRRAAIIASASSGALQSSGAITGDVLSNGDYGGGGEKYETGDDEGDEKKKQKNTRKASAPKEKQLQKMHAAYNKRAFRQPRNPLQNNAMFFSHSSPVNRPKK
jgi:hypothetical protein